MADVVAVAMSGGGPKGAWQAGANAALDAHWAFTGEYASIWCGVSVGAFNAAYRAMGKTGFQLENLWTNVVKGDRSIFRHHRPLSYFTGYGRGGLYDTAPMRRILQNHFNIKRISELNNKLRIGAVSLTTGTYHVFTEDLPDAAVRTAIMASAAHPLVFPPVQLKHPDSGASTWWTDGGVRNVTPLRSAIKAGATKVYVIMTRPENALDRLPPKRPNLLKRSLREFDILMDEAQADDLKMCQWINAAKRAGAPEANKYREVEVVVIRPKEPLDMFKGMDFDPDKLEDAMSRGFDDATAILKQERERRRSNA